jgi:CBS domain-containing protein
MRKVFLGMFLGLSALAFSAAPSGDSLVKDHMNVGVVATIKEGDSLKQAADMMFGKDYTALAVVDGQGKIIGQLSEGDLARYMVEHASWESVAVKESHLMRAPSVVQATDKMSKVNLDKSTFVVDDSGRLKGTVTPSDVFNSAARAK